MNAQPEPKVFVGVDWATREHQLCALDSHGAVLGQKTFLNTAAGLQAMIAWLLGLADGDPTALAVAIERPDGLVVEALLEAEIPTSALNPKQLDRFRDRFSPAGAKDDRRDARVLADGLRTDRRAFRRLVSDRPEVVELRALVREDDVLRVLENALGNRLREQLGRYYPQMQALLADRPDPFLWDLWKLAPTPQTGARVRKEAVAARLRKHRVRRLDVDAVTSALAAPTPRVAAVTTQAAVGMIRRLLPHLRLIHAQRRQCGERIDALLKVLETQPGEGKNQHPDATILRSLPGIGRNVLARMLSEAAEGIRLRDLSRLRALGGSAPVTKRSGQSCRVAMRRACNARLRFAYYHWARCAVQRDERSRAQYRKLRACGHSHGRALRGVVDRLLAIAVAMLRSGTLYDSGLRESRCVKQIPCPGGAGV
jgi:transposase